jgi:hypothetical protein
LSSFGSPAVGFSCRSATTGAASREYGCRAVGAADDDRTAAVIFYCGYLAAKANITIINTGNIANVMNRCVAKPNITVPEAFREALASKPTAKK